MRITGLRPHITREQVTAMFRRGFREFRYGQFRQAFDFYVPFRLFQVKVDDGRKINDTLLAIDASTAHLDLIQFDEIPGGDERFHLESEKPLPVSRLDVDQREAFKRLEEKIMRSVFVRGFFRLAGWRVSGEQVEVLYLPYWVGVYERRGQARLEIIDARRGRFEGAKLREIVADWFRSELL
jgi:hypothetical protein